jgi:hypothetical protein
MTDTTLDNRLDEEESPYLRAHADNPVNWQPWDEEAMAVARERDVPIFLSIGYSACHWCHVMAEESFEDEATAELLNDHYVPIKVDREERPDVDSIYQTICQQVTGQGGWPLSVWLTPEGDPFYVGTYFPKEPRRGQPSFTQLLDGLQESWADPEQRADIEQRANKWTSAIEGELQDVPDQPGDAPGTDLLEMAAEAAVRGADREFGGWGRGQKFPQTGRLHILARGVARTDDERYRDVIRETLDAMVDGGLHDHVGGGFHRYTTDREWVVPHFEKMLYDNAEIPRALLAGYQLTGTDRYAEAARDTFEFLQRELQHPEGGFYSTLDARSETDSGDRKEGEFYVWTRSQVREAVADETAADLFCDRYGVTAGGNFERGRSVLTRSTSVDELAEEYDLDPAQVEATLDEAREATFEARSERPRPARDEKVLAGWNGLAISALAEGAIVLDGESAGEGGDDGYAAVAAEALSFVREHLWKAEAGRLSRRFKDGEVKIDGYLEDYAFLGRGAFDLYQATGEVDHLAFALELARAIERHFWDEAAGTLYFTPADGEALIARPQELNDQSTPSSAGVAAELLLGLAEFAPEEGFEEIATRVLETHASSVEANPLQHASLALAADTHATGAFECTLVADDPPAAWRRELAGRYLPARLLAWRPADEDRLASWLDKSEVDAAPPIWADRGARDGEATVYVCRSFTCSPPKHDLGTALEWAAESL